MAIVCVTVMSAIIWIALYASFWRVLRPLVVFFGAWSLLLSLYAMLTCHAEDDLQVWLAGALVGIGSVMVGSLLIALLGRDLRRG